MPAGTPTATATPHPDTVVWALGSKPTTLDPALLHEDAAGAQVAAQVFDRLVGYRPDTLELAPGIAENWDADVDGMSYTFILRPNLTFQDGTPLDARAVVWNFERWMDPSHPQHKNDFMGWQSIFGGGEPTGDNELPKGLVKRVEALDERTVRFTLNAPFAPFVPSLAELAFGLSSPAAVARDGADYGMDGEHPPVGSGPFRVVSWDDDGTVRLEPFVEHWSGAPEAPALRFDVIEDAQARLSAVASGDAHLADLPPTVDPRDEPGVRVVARPARTNAWLMLNLTKPPFDDVRVRKAISLALDRTTLAAEHFGPLAEPAGQLLPPGFPGRASAIGAPAQDLETAKQLVADAGTGEFSLNIWVANAPRPYLPDPTGTADAVAAALKELGIDAKVRSESLRQFLSDRDRGRFSAWLLGWEAQTTDPDNFWFWHFGAGRQAAEGQYNRPDLAQKLLDAQRTLGSEERSQMYEDAAAIIDNDTARIFLAYTRPTVVVSPRVRGYKPGPMGTDSLETVALVPIDQAPTPLPRATATATLAPEAGTATSVALGTPEVTPEGTAEGAGTPGEAAATEDAPDSSGN